VARRTPVRLPPDRSLPLALIERPGDEKVDAVAAWTAVEGSAFEKDDVVIACVAVERSPLASPTMSRPGEHGPTPGEPASAPRRPSFRTAAAATYGTNLAVAVVSLGNVLIVSRALGPSGRGSVAFLTIVAMLMSNVAELGITQAAANLAGREPGLRRAIATTSTILAIVFGAAAAAAVAVLFVVFPETAANSSVALTWVALAAIPILILQMYLRFLVQADYGFALSNSAWLLGSVVTVAVNAAFAAFDALTVGIALVAWIGGQSLVMVMLAWYVARRLAGFGRPSARLARRMLGFGVRAHMGRIMLLGNYRLDGWLLGAMSGTRELGLYSVAVAWAETLFYLPTTLVMVQRPDLVRATRGEAARTAALVFRGAVLLTVPIALLLFLLAPVLCVWIFGEEFRGSVDDLRMLVPGAFGIVALKILGNALTAQRRPLLETAAVGVAFGATLGLDLLLIPPYGGFGAALASTLAYTAGGIAVVVIFCRALGANVRDLMPRGNELLVVGRSVRERFSRASRRGTAPVESTDPGSDLSTSDVPPQ
jgi:O-antigen/teichoic acid export membrane protein